MADIQDQKFAKLGLQKAVSNKKIVSYHRALDRANEKNPIIVLIHGYPESAYMWRSVIPLLPDKPLFVPDLPGYGSSAPTDRNDKYNVGLLIIEALWDIINDQNNVPLDKPPIVLVGHDRGARVAHRLHVSANSQPGTNIMGFKIVGLALTDIIPTLFQWQLGTAAKAQTGYFHWSFLANVSVSKPMIMAYGGGKWATDMIARWAGSNAEGLEKLKSGDALKVYSTFFDKESVIEASCRDYETGANVDIDAQEQDIANQQCITVPLLLVYSQEFLAKRTEKPMSDVWGYPWTKDRDLITAIGVGNGIGHFIPEEAPEVFANELLNWLR